MKKLLDGYPKTKYYLSEEMEGGVAAIMANFTVETHVNFCYDADLPRGGE